jgi:hypothetical protein
MAGILAIAPTAVVAQDNACSSIVEKALSFATESCGDIGRNQACYGNGIVNATPRESATDFAFTDRGDLANVVDINSIQLSALSVDTEVWGVSLLRIQANLPDTLPGQNVQFVLFGDVKMTNAADVLTEIPVTATAGVNVRLRPTTAVNNVIESLAPEEEVLGNGRLAENSWIRVRLNDETGTIGWVSAGFLQSDEDLSQLDVVAEDAPVFGTMQAFYLQSGIGDARCAEAPESGVLIQTPEGAGKITLEVNEVDIELSSTAFIQSAINDVMIVTVVEGQATVTAFNTTVRVPAGAFTTIPTDENGLASGPPTDIDAYNHDQYAALPIQTLDQTIVIAEPLDPEALLAAAIGLPQEGTWVITSATCPTQVNSTVVSNVGDGNTITVTDLAFGDPFQINRIADGTYAVQTRGETWTFELTSQTSMRWTVPGCTVDFEYSG